MLVSILAFWSSTFGLATFAVRVYNLITFGQESVSEALLSLCMGLGGGSWERCPGTRVVSRPAVTLGVKFLRLVREHLHLLGGKKGPKTKTTIKEKISHKKDGV